MDLVHCILCRGLYWPGGGGGGCGNATPSKGLAGPQKVTFFYLPSISIQYLTNNIDKKGLLSQDTKKGWAEIQNKSPSENIYIKGTVA